MKRTDLYICIFMYLFCAFFQHETQKFPEGARHYPHFVIGLLFLLTTVRLWDMAHQYLKNRCVVNDVPETFKGFLPKQFWTMFAAFLGFFVLMHFFGFYLASLVYILFCLHYFKIPKKHVVLVMIVMLALTYFTFGWFLNVPLPKDEILGEFL